MSGSMQKIGIITFHNANNYGAVLQNFALQKAIIKLGYNSETIDYHCDELEAEYKAWKSCPSSASGLSKAKYYVWQLINYHSVKKHISSFNKFRDSYLSVSAPYDKNNIGLSQHGYRSIVTGSDQVWNPDIIGDNIDVFSLEFVEEIPKASYAASAGKSEITNITLLNAVKKIDYVTTREKSLSEFLVSEGVDSRSVCDPVFLLSKEEWEIALGLKEVEAKILFYYNLAESKELLSVAKDIAKKKGFTIVCPQKRCKQNVRGIKNIFEAGPREFVQCIYNSSLSVVSSFHGLVFSIIFEKEFITFLDKRSSSRVADLLSELGLSERIFRSYDEYCERFEKLKPIDYILVKEKMKAIIKDSFSELTKICDLQN